jgi:xylulose-5-phosphate/fructose-6-phosphate phosphoketolase
MADTRVRHRAWTREHGEDLPEVAGWAWPGSRAAPVSSGAGGGR